MLICCSKPIINGNGSDYSQFGDDPKTKIKDTEIEEFGNSSEAKLAPLKSKVEQLRSVLEAAERRYNKEQLETP